ncbi:MAG: hypothetical protein NEA02_07295, partial [Thermoanaerobaculia bacterium]|nr:hypothetical protein [Thermoanaerobaculia bacterium]
MAIPLVPALSPGWPRFGGLWPLLLSVPFVAFGIVRARRGALTPAVLLLAGGFPLYALYAGNGVNLTSGDNQATRVLPTLVLTQGTVDLSKTPPFDRPRLPYAAVRAGDRVLDFFPSGTAFVALPHAALALLGSGGHVTPELVSRWEKHAAALITVAAAVLLWAAARRWGEGAALGAAFVFALATPVFANAAQALWSFTGEVFCLALALFLALRVRPLPVWAGIAAGAAFACRPTALAGAVAIGFALLATDRRGAGRSAAGLGAALAAVCAAQLALYGHPLGAYGAANTAHRAINADLARGLAGVLASPSRGLLVFCPWILLLPIGLARMRVRNAGLLPWTLASLGAAAGTVLLAASHVLWWGGWSLGPRLTTEAAPFLALASVPLFRAAGRPLRAAFLSLAAFAAATQLLLAYAPGTWEWDPQVLDPIGPRALWRWKEGQLAAAWGAPLPERDKLPITTPEGEDLSCSVDEPAEGMTVTGRLHAGGWARIPGA